MNAPRHDPMEEIHAEAARWVLRGDRGLTATEQDELSAWLAVDPAHGRAYAEQRWGWDELDRLAGLQTTVGAMPDPDLLAPKKRVRSRAGAALRYWIPAAIGLAAAIAIGLWMREARPGAAPMAATVALQTALAAPCERRTLADGTIVELNRGAAIEVAFTSGQRDVRLVRGEANFIVAKDPARPFVVAAGGVAVRAIGTVFNVHLDRATVDVVVTEGRVGVERTATSIAPRPEIGSLHVDAGQQVIVPLSADAGAPAPRVETLTAAQLEARLAWQPRLLDFTDAPLGEIVSEFNRRNLVQLVLADPALAGVRLSATFRSDNVEGFVRLMASDFDMKSEWRGEKEIALARAK